MKTFKEIILETRSLTEATFGGKDIMKVTRLIKPVLERRIGKKLYQYGGEGSSVKFKKAKSGNGVGVLYFVGDQGGALRLNWEFNQSKSATVTSADWWNSWSVDMEGYWSKPNYTLRGIKDLNSVQLVDILAKFAISPGTAKYSVQFEDAPSNFVSEDVDDLIAEASVSRRGIEFLQLAVSMYGQGEIKKGDLIKLRDENGYTPAETNFLLQRSNQGSQRGYYKIYPAEYDAKSGEDETTTDINPQLNKAFNAAMKRDIPIDELFQDLGELTDLVIDNYRPSLLVTGSGGTGKSFTVMQRLAAKSMKKGEDYKIIKGGVSIFGLYMELFLARNGKLLIFDDCDSVFKDITSQNLLKAALDSYDEREISWTSKSTMQIDPKMSRSEMEEIFLNIEADLLAGDEKVKLPSFFPFEGRVIFISNLTKDNIPQPILSRSLVIDVTLSDDEMTERMRMVLKDVANNLGVDNQFAEETMNALMELSDSGKIAKPTMRTLPSAMKIKMSGNPRWSKLLKYTS